MLKIRVNYIFPKIERINKKIIFLTSVKNGVLQGDPFSSLLSDIYYGYLTKKRMIEFLQDKKV